MTAGLVVSNSSPLIALHQIDQLELMRQLFGTVFVPPAVATEIRPSLQCRPSWITEHRVARPIEPRVLRATLDLGEREAIGLAVERRAEWVVLDDLAARKLAEELNLPVVGTVGLLVRAKQRGLLAAVQPSLDALIAADFFISSGFYRSILAAVNEGE